MTLDWRGLRALFDELVELGEADRRARLGAIGDGSTETRARLEAMLVADGEAADRLRPFEEAVALDATTCAGSAPAQDPLGRVGTVVGRYRVEEVLGGGGMGVVYGARDLRLERRVALKFLPPHLSLDVTAKQRFLREARAASSLDHPNICTIFGADEAADGALYIAMACYEGETIRARLAAAPLDVAEATDVLVQAARGLAAAHAQGLVHRDVKPENLLITAGGTLKILDFGVAKTPFDALTLPDQRPGTAAYMAPEQARGGTVDGKADVWSLGIVVHELLTGVRPMPVSAGDRARPSRLRPDVPPALDELVARMLAFDPFERPSAADVAAGASTSGISAAAPTVSGNVGRSIAVLPFADLSRGADQGYLCEGMTEELLHALARVDGLRVASALSSMHAAGVSSDVRVVGARLSVDTLIEGSIRQDGSSIRVTVRLVRVSDASVLWSDRYDRELKDVFAIQEDIARSVVETLRLTLSGAPLALLRAARTRHVEAYEHYLMARRFFLRDTRHDLESARQLFARSIEIDPEYARAHAGLSDACAFLYKHFDRAPALLEEAERASGRAIELDATSADAHTSRAVVHWLRGRLTEAESKFETAVRLDPDSFEAHYLYGMYCYSLGRTERAIAMFTSAWALRPDDFQCPNLLGALQRAAGREGEARASFRQGLDLARRHLELNPDNVRARYQLAFAQVGTGHIDEGLASARGALEMAPDDAMVLYNAAAVHAVAGRVDAGLDYLERAIAAGFAYRPDLEFDPDFETLRANPRFQVALDRLS